MTVSLGSGVAMRRFGFKSVILSSVCAVAIATAAHAQSKSIDIPAGDLKSALDSYMAQSGVQLFYKIDDVRGLNTHGVHGQFEPKPALGELLADTGLTVHQDTTGPIVISRESAPKNAQAASNEAAPLSPVSGGLESVIVTGTNIRGVEPVGSPVTVYTKKDIEQSGAATVDQFARTMPQNFSDVDAIANPNSNAIFAKVQTAGTNLFYGGGFDLHGLGTSSTLTLLNGQRLAPSGLTGALTDSSQVPLSAISRIEVLDDGASAIYGADAVAGVVNIITRKDFDGAETSVRYSAATEGGDIERTFSQLLGKSWNTGNVFLNYEYDGQGGLDASQRNYIGSRGGPESLIPKADRNSVFLSGHQDLDDQTSVTANANYTNRTFSSLSYENSPADAFAQELISSGRAVQYGGNITVERSLFADWQGSLTGNYSKVHQLLGDTTNIVSGATPSQSTLVEDANSNVLNFDALANGSLFTLPGGAVKAAIGASYRQEEYDTNLTSAGKTTATPNLLRHVTSVFGELFIPVIGEANETPGAKRLELSVSARYDDYSDFGSTANPKVGVLWEPIANLNVRGSYGTSFQAPLLSQVGGSVFPESANIPDPSSSTGKTDTLLLQGANPDLGPQTSTSFTAGFDLTPDWVPTLKIGATYFNTAFDNRIFTPPVTGAGYFTNPALAQYITRNPALAVVTAAFSAPGFEGDFGRLGPSGVKAIFDDRYTNVAGTKESGIDLTGSYEIPVNYGRLTLSGAVALLLENNFQTISTLPPIVLLNNYGAPTKWKTHGNIAWADDGFTAAVTLNYVGSYRNTLFTPFQPIGSWTTADLYLSYDTGKNVSSETLQDIRISLSVQNVTDERPPYAPLPPADLLPGVSSLPYDATNASPVGRLIAIRLTKAL